MGAVLAAFVVTAGCGKTSSGGATAESSAAPAASGSAAAVVPAPSAKPAGIAHLQWEGTYAAKPGVVNVPEEAHDKAWPHDPASAAAAGGPATGAGTLSLAVTGAHGEVTGTAQGALGDLVVNGVFDGNELRANLSPKDPADPMGMRGFMLLGTAAPAGSAPPAVGAALSGTMRVSSHDAKVVRDAEVKIAVR
jgi:hypothetical protein